MAVCWVVKMAAEMVDLWAVPMVVLRAAALVVEKAVLMADKWAV